MKAKAAGLEGKAESCAACPFPQLNERNRRDEEVVYMIRQMLLGLKVSLSDIYLLYNVPEYRKLELLKKAINLQSAMVKNGRNA